MRYRHLAAAMLFAAVVPASLGHAAINYTDSFDGDSSASYSTYITAGASSTVAGGLSGDARFAFDYSVLGIPSAPHSTGGSTKGLALRTDNLQNSAASAVVGTSAISTKNLNLPSQFTLSVDVWSNYIGGTSIASSGSNGTTGVAFGVGTSGNQLQYIAANDGLLFEGFGDNGGGANQAYRIYTNNSHPNPTNSSYFAAGTTSTSASNTDPYYTAFLPSVTAPTAQSSAAPATQGGNSAAGTLGFAWHTVTIVGNGTNYIWSVDGHTIATVPYSAVNLGGGNISIGNDDTGTGGNTAAANQLYNVEIFDNLSITPEPATLTAVASVGVLLAGRRRRA